MTASLVIVAIALGTYALRVSMFVLVTSRPVPKGLDRMLQLVGPAAVAGLVAAALVRTGGDGQDPVELLAVGAAFVVVRRTGNVAHAFVVGLPVMWALGSVLG